MNKLLRTNKALFGLLALMLVLYVGFRLWHIMSLPLFTDEAIYVRWSQIARYDANWRFISLTDGKQPSFVWLAMTIMRFVTDPLLASRLVSVGAGLGSLIGLFFLGRELFKKTWVGVVSAAFYLVYPMAVVYDRMALYDSLVGMFYVWALYLEVLLVRRVRLDVALLLGMVIGAGTLTKTNAFFTIPLLFFSLALFDFSQKDWQLRLLRFIGLAAISVFIAFGMYSILRLSPFYHIINDKNAIFVFPFHEWIKNPGQFLVSNLRGLFDWLQNYMSVPWLVLVVLAFIKQQKNLSSYLKSLGFYFIPFLAVVVALYAYRVFANQKDFFSENIPFVSFLFLGLVMIRSLLQNREQFGEKLFLVIAFSMPFVYLAIFGRTIYPRFIFFMSLPLIVLAAYSLVSLQSSMKKVTYYAVLIAFFFLVPMYTSYYVVTDFARAPIPRSDKDQYVNGWPAGGGIQEAITYLMKRAETQKIYVASLGDFGSLPKYAVEIYLGDNKNVVRRDPGIYPVPDTIPDDLLKNATIRPTFILSSNQDEFDEKVQSWPIKKIFVIQKGTGESYTKLYQVLPQ